VTGEYQDPQKYVTGHTFVDCLVTKENAVNEIKKIINQDYDVIWSVLWGMAEDDVAGVEAVEFLESTGHSMVGTSSKFLAMSKLDIRERLARCRGINLPKQTSATVLDLTELVFPTIVKPGTNRRSLRMTSGAVCNDIFELQVQINLLKANGVEEILVEEYIGGVEASVLVLETIGGVIGLTPLVYDFPTDWTPTQKFLHFYNKFKAIEDGTITFKAFDGQPFLGEEMKRAAVTSFQALGVADSGYARVHLRVRGNEVFVIKVIAQPMSSPFQLFTLLSLAKSQC